LASNVWTLSWAGKGSKTMVFFSHEGTYLFCRGSLLYFIVFSPPSRRRTPPPSSSEDVCPRGSLQGPLLLFFPSDAFFLPSLHLRLQPGRMGGSVSLLAALCHTLERRRSDAPFVFFRTFWHHDWRLPFPAHHAMLFSFVEEGFWPHLLGRRQVVGPFFPPWIPCIPVQNFVSFFFRLIENPFFDDSRGPISSRPPGRVCPLINPVYLLVWLSPSACSRIGSEPPSFSRARPLTPLLLLASLIPLSEAWGLQEVFFSLVFLREIHSAPFCFPLLAVMGSFLASSLTFFC